MSFYAGDFTPRDAYEMLRSDPSAVLVDVRTSAEWHYVGKVDLAAIGKDAIYISWRNLPDMSVNVDFMRQLEQQIPNKEVKIFFLCRTGGRSLEAAAHASKAGYKSCYNISYGFEGDLDPRDHRGNLTGWKAEKLPWRQD